MTSPGTSLWAFSLERYGRPGVAAICLQLQDEAGADVNMVLACLWCAQRGVALDRNDMAAFAAGDVAKWHDRVVRPLRAARRAMKGALPGLSVDAVEVLRSRLKTVELETERFEQILLEAELVQRPPTAVLAGDPAGAALANLLLYAETLQGRAQPDVLQQLASACID